MDNGKGRKAVRGQEAQIAITPAGRALLRATNTWSVASPVVFAEMAAFPSYPPLSRQSDQTCPFRILVAVDGGVGDEEESVWARPILSPCPLNFWGVR